ncbi:hypothetical protein B484DRAFT_400012 [Ochromonadaceae sp. CCMP2298]|nr:hypothetical protein B484DRAFT_400012 [Ochromonadaceae sp. CCMP2298]
MSLSSVINKYPVAAGELLASMALLSATHSNIKWTVVESAELAENDVFVLPLLDLVCEIVGGTGLAGGKLGVGQTGITFVNVQCVLVPCAWVLLDAKTAGLFKVTAAPGATAALRRMFSRAKMDTFVDNLIFDNEKLRDVCMMIKSKPGPAKPLEHPHAGLHLYPSVHSLAVMRGDFGASSKFQHAIMLHFSSLSHAKVSLVDFADPKVVNAIRFDKGRSTLAVRGFLRPALEFVGVFLQCFSHGDFQDALLPINQIPAAQHQPAEPLRGPVSPVPVLADDAGVP